MYFKEYINCLFHLLDKDFKRKGAAVECEPWLTSVKSDMHVNTCMSMKKKLNL
jgi:hypothetical protein